MSAPSMLILTLTALQGVTFIQVYLLVFKKDYGYVPKIFLIFPLLTLLLVCLTIFILRLDFPI